MSKHAIITAVLLFLSPVSNATEYEYAEEAEYGTDLARLSDLREVFSDVENTGRPLLIEFSTAWCMYCEALEEQVLVPMLRNPEYSQRVIIRKLEVDYATLIDSDGERLSGASFAMRYGIDLYPTLLILDHLGREIAPRIVGITVLDYVGDKIDRSLGIARRELAVRSGT